MDGDAMKTIIRILLILMMVVPILLGASWHLIRGGVVVGGLIMADFTDWLYR